MTTELDNLAGIAAAADGVAADAAVTDVGGENQPPVAPVSRLDEARDMIKMFVGLVCGFAPEAESIWTHEAQERSAAVIEPILEKYDISMTAIPCELVAAVVVVPLLYQTSKLVATKIAERKAQEAAATQPAAQPPAKTETPGAAVHSQVQLYKQ